MRNRIQTEDDALALIAATHSDQRPDPYEATPFGNLRQWFEGNGIESAPSTRFVSCFCQMTADTPEWNSDSHTELLEEFLKQELGDKQAKKRTKQLMQGSALTEAEHNAFVEAWERDTGAKVFYLYQVGPPFTASKEQRSIYYLCEHRELGQFSDLTGIVGPLRSLDEVLKSFPVSRRGEYQFLDFPRTEDGERFRKKFLKLFLADALEPRN